MTARRRPLYFRLLGVRHLRAGPVTTFLLFEGSIALGVLLAFGDIVSPWGAVAIPVTVAIMVKVHDRVARALVAPVAVVQLYATPRLRDQPNVGRSVVTPTSRPNLDTGEPTAVGIAPVPALGRATVSDPATWAGHHSPELRHGPRPRDADPDPPTGPHRYEGADRYERADRVDGADRVEGADRHESVDRYDGSDRGRDSGDPAEAAPDGVTASPAIVERIDADWLRGNQGHFSV